MRQSRESIWSVAERALRGGASGISERGAGASVLRAAADDDSLVARRHFKRVPMTSDRLKEGMVLSRDLLHHEGYLLLSQGHRLDDSLIKQLKEIEMIGGRPITVYIRMEDRQ